MFRRMSFIFLYYFLIFSDPLNASHPSILPLNEQTKVINTWLEIRLERRIPEELEIYLHIVSIARQIFAEAFSNQVITCFSTIHAMRLN